MSFISSVHQERGAYPRKEKTTAQQIRELNRKVRELEAQIQQLKAIIASSDKPRGRLLDTKA